MKQKVITKVLKVSDNTKERMCEYFKFNKRAKTPPYAIFQADEEDTVVTLYESGKVVFQGISADIDANMWNEVEISLNGKSGMVDNDKKKDNSRLVEKVLPIRINSIGSDEVGTGDYFGPIVVTACYVSVDNIDFLIDLGVRDSKKMSDEKIVRIVPEIIKKIPYKTFILSNSDYNKYRGYNMNKMKAILHNKVLYELKSLGYQYDYIVVDQFESSKSYFNHIKESNRKVLDIFFLTKAEDQCLSVACASLISRYIFLREMDKISKNLGVVLPKGAGDSVCEVGKEIVRKFGVEKLDAVAKLSFKNTDKILDKNK